jgi:uncharacterized protein
MNMKYEWDDEKAELNLRKHGIRFQDAVKAFEDPNGVELLDEDHSKTEVRFQLIAIADGTVLLRIFTERIDAIRLISARRAGRRELEIYYGREN